MKRWLMLLAVGAAAGTVNGIFGTGGGTLLVLTLPFICGGLEGRGLFANVSAAILPISVASALTYSGFSPVDLSKAVVVGGAALIGGAMGAYLLGRLNPKVLKLIFSVVMAVSGVVMLVGR